MHGDRNLLVPSAKKTPLFSTAVKERGGKLMTSTKKQAMPHKYMRFLIIKKVKIIEALCHFVSSQWVEARLR